MRIKSTAIKGLAAAALVALSATACAAASSTDTSKPVAQIPALSGQATAVALDAGFLSALTSLKLTPGTIGTATLADGSLSFPITGGNVTYYTPYSRMPYVTGDIEHKGSGLSLTAGSTKVELTNFDIDPGTSKLYGDVTVNGASAATHAYLFNLDGSTLKPLQSGADGTAILEGTRVLISPDAATVLDKVFATDAVKAGLLLGIAKITVNTN